MSFIIISVVVVAIPSLLTYFNLESLSLPAPPDSNLGAEDPVSPVTAGDRCQLSLGWAVSPSPPTKTASRDSPSLLQAASQAWPQKCAGAERSVSALLKPRAGRCCLLLPRKSHAIARADSGLLTVEAGGGRSRAPPRMLAPPRIRADRVLAARLWFREILRPALTDWDSRTGVARQLIHLVPCPQTPCGP